VDTYGAPKAPDADSTPGYTQWYNDNWGDGTANKLRFDAFSELWDIADSKLSLLGPPPPGQEPGLGAFIDFDGNKQVLQPGVDNLKDYIKNGLTTLFANAFQPKSNYALLMGAGEVLRDALELYVNLPVGGQAVQAVINNLVSIDLDTITHNRVRVPEDLPVLSFNLFTPVMLNPDAQLQVTFKGTALDPGLADSAPLTVNLEAGFWSKRNYTVQVPDQFKGKTALLEFKFTNLESTSRVSLTPDDVLEVLDPTSVLGQLYFLDDIKFSKGIQATITNPVDENGTATLDITFDPAIPANQTTVTVDWRDGTLPPLVYTVLPGGGHTVLTHQYLDDKPTGTSEDRKVLIVTVDNAIGGDTALVETLLRNVAPEIDPLTLDVTELEEGEELELSGTFTDVGTLDTFKVYVDWGTGEEPEEITNFIPAFMGQPGSFSATHLYVDDDPDSGTPEDELKPKVIIIDDDGGETEREAVQARG